MPFVFVYGTLLRGERHHAKLVGARFLGPARTVAAFTLVSLGRFPGLVRGGQVSVQGEVYAVDPDTLAALDLLEGHPHFYRREPIALAPGAPPGLAPEGEVLAYILSRDAAEGAPRIDTGSWRAWVAAGG